MVYGFRIIGEEYYSEWGFNSVGESKKKLEEILKIFHGEWEIFEKQKNEIRVITKSKQDKVFQTLTRTSTKVQARKEPLEFF